MGCAQWDFCQGERYLAEELNYFLYENGKPTQKGGVPGIKRNHTYEELWDKLENIRQMTWQNYDDMCDCFGFSR